LNPFADRVFPKLNVASSLRDHVVRPSYTSIVVIEKKSGRGDIGKDVPGVHHALTHVAKVHHLFGSRICCPNLASKELREVWS
jgi:hypothetical protein